MAEQENVEAVRQTLEEVNKGALPGDVWHPDVAIDPREGWPEGGSPVKGIEDWSRQVERLRDSWEEVRIEVDDVRPAGPTRVAARFRYVTTGKDSGISFDTPMSGLYEFDGGRIT